MYKIFKYEVDRQSGKVNMPVFEAILRVAHVDDGFYKGDFVWAIVNVENPAFEQFLEHHLLVQLHYGEDKTSDFFDPHEFEKQELRVKEKQTIEVPGILCGAGEEDGKIYVHYIPTDSSERTYDIVVFKTGQEIDVPVERLKYLGLNRLWIIQELGLYTFLCEP
jgi:hypothetical protein